MDVRSLLSLMVITVYSDIGESSMYPVEPPRVTSLEPKFDTLMVNVTVKAKSTAILPCPIDYLGKYQVVWTDQFSTLLTFEDRRIIDDDRISVERPYTHDWNLHIRDVRYSDQGIYNCQINTEPVKMKTINLIVLVPAKILEHLSSNDVTVREGDTVTLVCNATGTPQPAVSWYRLPSGTTDTRQSELCDSSEKVGVNGEVLVIHNVTRYCGDSYECMAFNGVAPAASRIMRVYVEFAPEVYLPNKRIGQEKGKETILECTATAFPHAVNFWEKDGVQIVTSSLKYRLDVYDEGENRLTLSLRVFNIEESDFGPYTCVSSNELGEDSETMILYDYTRNAKTTTSVPTTTSVFTVIQPTLKPKETIDPVIPYHPTRDDRYSSSAQGSISSGQKATNRPPYTAPYRPSDKESTRIVASKEKTGDFSQCLRVNTVSFILTISISFFLVNSNSLMNFCYR